MKQKSLSTNIALAVVALVMLVFAGTIWLIADQAGEMQKKLAFQNAEEMAQKNALFAKAELETALDTARTLAQSFEGLKARGMTDRETATLMLKRVLEKSPDFLGVWVGWERNAFDGKDFKFANTAGTDRSGRFIPYWNRGSGKILLEPLLDYDNADMAGEYYQLPKRTGRETIMKPMAYKVGGKDFLLTSLEVPIFIASQFAGVVGVDIALSDLQAMTSSIKPYGTGFAQLISNEGLVVADIDPKNAGKEIGATGPMVKAKEAIKAGKVYRLTEFNPQLGTDTFSVYVPINIGHTTTPWSFAVTVPISRILASVTALRNLALTIGMVAILLLAVMVSVALRKLVILNQELSRSNEELEQFAYVASHDLQEPLRMVGSYTQLLLKRYKDRLDEDANEFMGFIIDGAVRMQRLIDDLLTFSRIGKQNRPFEPVATNVAIKKAQANLQKRIEESGAEVTYDSLPMVMGDEIQLEQLFQNLIGNGIKFSKEGERPVVHISVRRAKSEWFFSVADNGIGIESQYFERIFTIFQRLHGKSEYPGTGIGLAICKKIVERHGGKIWVNSVPGQGTTFSFSIPVK